MSEVKKRKTLAELQEENRIFMEEFRKRGEEIHNYIDNSSKNLSAELRELGYSEEDSEKPLATANVECQNHSS